MNWFLLNFFWHVSNTIAQNAARLLVNIRKQRSSGHMFLSLAQVVSQPFFTFSPAKSRRGGTVTWAWGKSDIWCWEFDVKKRHFHQFRTTGCAMAVDFYEANKFTMWG